MDADRFGNCRRSWLTAGCTSPPLQRLERRFECGARPQLLDRAACGRQLRGSQASVRVGAAGGSASSRSLLPNVLLLATLASSTAQPLLSGPKALLESANESKGCNRSVLDLSSAGLRHGRSTHHRPAPRRFHFAATVGIASHCCRATMDMRPALRLHRRDARTDATSARS